MFMSPHPPAAVAAGPPSPAVRETVLRAPAPPSPAPRVRVPEGEARRRVRAAASGEARDVGGFLGDEFEERRGAFLGLLNPALDRFLDLPRLGDPLAVAAERLGEIGVIAADIG